MDCTTYLEAEIVNQQLHSPVPIFRHSLHEYIVHVRSDRPTKVASVILCECVSVDSLQVVEASVFRSVPMLHDHDHHP